MKITSKNKIIMAELVGEVLEEMKAKTEEGEVTQRFNKCYLLQRWRPQKLSLAGWSQKVRRPPRCHPYGQQGQGCEIRFGAMEKMQSFGQIWSHYSVTIGGRAARRPGGTE